MATRGATRPAILLLLAVYLMAGASLPSEGSPAAATMAAAAKQDTKSTTSSTTSTTTTSSSSSAASSSSSAASGSLAASAQSTQAVAAEAAAEAAAMALGGIKNGLESALSIVPASINLPVGSPTTTAAPAAATTVVLVESPSTTTTTTAAPAQAATTSTSTTSTTGAPSTPAAAAAVEVIEVHANGTSAAQHKHSTRRINATDILHKFDLFIDPVCEQLAKLTDKQISKLLSQLKQINTLVSMNLELLLLSTLKRVPANHEHRAEKSASHDGIAKCFNEHKFGFESSSSDVMSRVQLSDFCAARNNATSENYKLWSECARRNWSPAIDKELDSSFRDRIDGQTKAAKRASSSVGGALASKLSTVELSLIDSIVAHLHDEQVQEIASELEHEQKKHNKPPVVVANGKLSPSPIEQSQQQQHQQHSSNWQQVVGSPMAVNQQPPTLPASSLHDQIISASPLLSSSQQQHHELLLPNNLQATASNQLQLTAAGQQQHLQHVGGASAMNFGQQQHQQVLTTTDQQQQVVATTNQQHQQETIVNVHNQQQQLITGSNMIAAADAVPIAAEQAIAPVALIPAANQEQHVAASTFAAVQDQAAVNPIVGAQNSAATLATSQSHQEAQSNILQQPIVATHEQQPHANDLVQIAKMGVAPTSAADEHHQLVSTSTSSSSSSTHQGTIQVMPTISPIASFLLNSIDFATRPPSTLHPVGLVPQAAAVGNSLVAPAVVQPEMPIVVPAEPSVGTIAAVNHEQQQTASLTSSSSSISASQESTMSSNMGQAAVLPGSLAQAPLTPEPILAPAIAPEATAAAVVAAHQQSGQPIVVHPPITPELVPVGQQVGLGGATAATLVPAAVKTAETASISASASQHTETIVTPEPPLPLMQQPVDTGPMIDPAVIKNVNSALEAMSNTNISSGVVNVSSGSSSNTTLFILSPSTTSTTPAPTAKSSTSTSTTTTAEPTSTTTTTKRPADKKSKKGKKKSKSHDEKFAELRARFGAAQVHDVIVIGEHRDGDDELEDYDDHHEHHDGEHEHTEHHGEGSHILEHSSDSKSSEDHEETKKTDKTTTTTTSKPSTTTSAAAAAAKSTSTTTTSKPTSTTTTTKGPLAKITTTVVDVGGLDGEHKDHEHLLAGLKAGDVIHVDAGEAA